MGNYQCETNKGQIVPILLALQKLLNFVIISLDFDCVCHPESPASEMGSDINVINKFNKYSLQNSSNCI